MIQLQRRSAAEKKTWNEQADEADDRQDDQQLQEREAQLAAAVTSS